MSAAAKSATPTNSLTRREAVDIKSPWRLDLHNDGQHEWPPSGTFTEEPAQLDAQFLLDEALVRPFLDARLIDNVAEEAGAVGQQRLAVFHHEAARDDVRNALERPRLL